MKKILSISIILFVAAAMATGQGSGYVFTIKKELGCTPVKDQAATNTCWCFSGISMFESELIRMGKKQFDLSEMFIVRHTYEKKADMYARMHGNSTFAGGGEYGDLLTGTAEVGLVPDVVYPGMNYGGTEHNHHELDGVLKGYMKPITESTVQLTTAWKNGFKGILDAYLGKVPENFTNDGKTYSPSSFAKELGINPDDYVIFTSFSHHPFYKQFPLEVPDNWAAGLFWNLPVEDMMQVIDYSLANGYTVAWASDVSDRGFSMKEGVAIVPEKNLNGLTTEEITKVFASPQKEKTITQEMRQAAFDNYSTTDDHGMHIVGLATDQTGSAFYKVKNSWGITGKYDGFLFVSRSFIMLRTTNLMVNKNGIPAEIRKKMGI